MSSSTTYDPSVPVSTVDTISAVGGGAHVHRRISWAAIFGGVILVVAVQLLLSLLGAGLGWERSISMAEERRPQQPWELGPGSGGSSVAVSRWEPEGLLPPGWQELKFVLMGCCMAWSRGVSLPC